MQKGLAPILVLVLIVAISVSGYFWFNHSNNNRVLFSNENRTIATSYWKSTVASSTPIPAATPDTTTNWKTFKDEKFNFQIKYPLDAEIIRPNFNTIEDSPSDVIIKFNYDKKCLDKMGEDGKIECSGDAVDIFVISNASKTAQQLVEENKKSLNDAKCVINTNVSSITNMIAFELTGCLISGSSFYYITGTDRHIFKIGVSKNNDLTTKQILSSFKIINPDILFTECKVGKDDVVKNQCPDGYKCEFTGEYPDEVNNLGNCVRQ